MKLWVVILGSTILGIVGGLTVTLIEISQAREQFRPVNEVEFRLDASTGDSTKIPRVEVINGSQHDFGTMERFATERHSFILKNVGNHPLTLEVGRTSCKCTLSHLADTNLQPGDTTEVQLEWNAKTTTDDVDFSQVAEIHTNDPQQRIIRLRVFGRIVQNLRAVPDIIPLSRISSNSEFTTQIRLFSYRDEQLEITDVEYLAGSTADYFSLETEPLPAEDLQEERGAQAGLLATLRIAPGLPLGPINQSVRIYTNLGKDAVIEIPVEGTVVGDLLLTGPANLFDRSVNLLDLGSVPAASGTATELRVIVKGPYRQDVDLSLDDVDPEGYLDVQISEREEINDGKAIMYRVQIAVPGGKAPVNRRGGEHGSFGKIVLRTTHPQTKLLPIYVKFAVE